MAGYISEFFGYRAEDTSAIALQTAAKSLCPFLNSPCTKTLSRDGTRSGACAIRQKTEGSPNVICCPNRIYADNYKMLVSISRQAFGKQLNLYSGRIAIEKARTENGAIAVFGHGWGGELRLPQRKGTGSYFVDWVLAKLDGNGNLEEFTAIEVQTIDTTGNYREARRALLEERKISDDTVGFNWEKRIKANYPAADL